MGSQSNSAVTLRQDLTELMEEITFDELGLQADVIAPGVGVSEIAASFPVLPREVRMKVPDTARHSDGSYASGQWEWNQDAYICYEFGFQEPVDNVSNMVHSKFIDQEEISTQLAYEGLLLGRESRVASALFNTTTFTGATNTVAITHEWDDATNAVPLANIDAAYAILRAKCGLARSRMSLILSDDLIDYFFKTTEVVGLSKYTIIAQTMGKAAKLQWMADYLGIKEVIETSALYDTAALSSAASIGKFWSNEYAMLCLLDKSSTSLKTRGVIRQVVYSPYSSNYVLESYEKPDFNQTIIRAREYRGIKVMTDYGVLLTNMKTAVSGGV